MMSMASPSIVKERINNSLNRLFSSDNNFASTKPPVCMVCDRFTGPEHAVYPETKLKARATYFQPHEPQSLPKGLLESYQYKGEFHKAWMKKCMLSPRSIFVHSSNRSERGFIVCTECENDMNCQMRPTRSISNGWFFGQTPQILLDLTEAELAIITPVKSFGYCFTYVGGRSQKLKGTLGYYKVKQKSIIQTIAVANRLSQLMNKNVVFIIHGEFTEEQLAKVQKKRSIRPEKLRLALIWLINNNEQWKSYDVNDVDRVIDSIDSPTHVDMSTTAKPFDDATETNEKQRLLNIEDEETFGVYFPDGTMTNHTGGKESANAFEKAIMEAQKKGFEGSVVADLTKQFTDDYVDNSFVNSCLLQFPYGRGGPNEMRLDRNENDQTFTLDKYADNLTYISNPQFHKPMFVLKLFNMGIRSIILKTARQRLNGNRKLWQLRDDLNATDFTRAANERQNGRGNTGSATSNSLLNTLDSMARTLPHTDAAAGRARQWMDTLQHHFGLGGVFLTVTPDDENSFLVSLYSQTDNHGQPIDISNLSHEQLSARSKKKQEIRLGFPGITALNFEYILDIVISDVIGWDVKKNQPTKCPGLFGKPLAYGGAIEEQGRTSLHVHFIIWLEGFDTYLANMNSPNIRSRLQSERHIRTLVDNSISTSLIDCGNKQLDRRYAKIFDHDCKTPISYRKRPRIVDDQQLRNLRHKLAHKENDTIAYCEACNKTWNNEQLVMDYLTNVEKIQGIESLPDRTKLLQGMCYEYTKPASKPTDVRPSILHTKCDLHSTCHAHSCFKKRKATSISTACYDDECRMRLPALKKPKTTIEEMILGDSNYVSFFSWFGTESRRKFFQVHPKRNEYDLFMNTYVPAISESRIGGNTNGRIITPGPLGIYVVKYPTKNTQKENEEPYKQVIEGITKLLSGDRKHEVDRTESLRMVIYSGFAQNKTNIVGASMASFLTRRKSRFVWSHKFAYIPLDDLVSIVTSGEIKKTFVKSYKGKPYADVMGLHYLCRPSELEDLSPYEFFEDFEVVSRNVNNRQEELLEFIDTEFFEHSTSQLHKLRNGSTQNILCVRPRSQTALAWVSTFHFNDTALFKGNILTCPSPEINDEMEKYARSVLCLCHSYRSINDLKKNNSYVLKLREIRTAGLLKNYEQYLQNIQDARANFCRVSPTADELQSKTSPFQPKEETKKKNKDKKDEEEEQETLQGLDLDKFLDDLSKQVPSTTNVPVGQKNPDFIPKKLNLRPVQCRGSHRCGIEGLCKLTKPPRDNTSGHNFISHFSINPTRNANHATCQEPPRYPTKQDIIKIMIHKTGTGDAQHFGFFSDENPGMRLPEANGTAKSITQWAFKTNLDKDQRRAFEVFASSFVLSFIRDAESKDNQETQDQRTTRHHVYLKEKLRLVKLAGKLPSNAHQQRLNTYKHENLICFLHGPGGSGKSAVMEMLIAYCKEYCGHVDETFNENTIVVTACSGVAATLIGGSTIHSAVHVNKQIHNIPNEEKQKWEHTRLMVIDEISFASETDVAKIEKRVCYLKDRQTIYGGIDIIFCGDLRQLEPCGSGQVPIYENEFREFHGAINCYLELCGMHRFKKDMAYGMIMMRMRNGKLTEADIDVINSRVIKNDRDIPDDVQYATYHNKDRAAINNGLYQKFVRQHGNGDCLIVLSSQLRIQTGKKTYMTPDNNWESFFWTNCGEGDCNPLGFSGRFDPALLLYKNRPVMVNKNEDVSGGIANGTRAYVERIVLKDNITPGELDIGINKIPAVRADQIKHIILRRHDGTFFNLEPIKHSFAAKLPLPASMQNGGKNKDEIVKMTGVQLPIICSNATTGHKLQGASCQDLFVHSWTLVRNWAYVVLSRVKTLKGLYLRKPLDKKNLDRYNDIPVNLQQLISTLRQCRQKTAFNQQQYDDIYGADTDEAFG